MLGPYTYPHITNTNGYNTYVTNNMWAAGGTGMTQTLTAVDPGTWQVVAKASAGGTAVLSYPNTQQLFNDWTGNGFNGSGSQTDTPLHALTQLTSTFAEDMSANRGTVAEAAYDIWLSKTSGRDEIMIWVDNAGRGTGGADQKGSATFGGQKWTLLQYGDGEISGPATPTSGPVPWTSWPCSGSCSPAAWFPPTRQSARSTSVSRSALPVASQRNSPSLVSR